MTDSSKPKLLGSCRLNLAIYCFFCLTLLFVLRFNFSTAMICMIGTRAMNSTTDHVLEGEFAWDKSHQAYLLSAFFYGYILTQVLGGWLSNKIGAKLQLVVGLAMLGILTILLPSIARFNYWLLFANRFTQGFITGLIFPSLYTTFNRWAAPEERATLMVITFTGTPVSAIICAPMSSLLCSTGIDGGWPMVFYVSGALAILWAVLFQLFTANSPETHPRISMAEKKYLQASTTANQHQPNQATPWKKIFTSKALLGIVIAHTSTNYCFYLMMVNLPSFVNEVFHVGILKNGLICSIPFVLQLFMIPTAKWSDWLIKNNYGTSTNVRKLFTSAGFLSPALLVFLLPYLSKFSQIVVLSIGMALFNLILTGGYYVTHANFAGPFSGITFGVMNTISQIPGLLIPWVIVFIAPHGTNEEWYNVFYIMAAVNVLGTVAYAMLGTTELQPWAKVEEKYINQNETDAKDA